MKNEKKSRESKKYGAWCMYAVCARYTILKLKHM